MSTEEANFNKKEVLDAIDRLEAKNPLVSEVFYAMDKAYADGVDHCIKIVKWAIDEMLIMPVAAGDLKKVLSKLEELKKTYPK